MFEPIGGKGFNSLLTLTYQDKTPPALLSMPSLSSITKQSKSSEKVMATMHQIPRNHQTLNVVFTGVY
jgi:hypothetical protein